MSAATVAIEAPQFTRSFDYEAVSASSEESIRKWGQFQNFLQGSASDWKPVVHAATLTIRNECSAANWDGEGAMSISDHVIRVAERIVSVLFELIPKGTPAPELVPEADGEVCINWTLDVDNLFSLSVGSNGKINFAGQFGNTGGIHGWRRIDEKTPSALDESLQDVARHIERLFRTPEKRGAA